MVRKTDVGNMMFFDSENLDKISYWWERKTAASVCVLIIVNLIQHVSCWILHQYFARKIYQLYLNNKINSSVHRTNWYALWRVHTDHPWAYLMAMSKKLPWFNLFYQNWYIMYISRPISRAVRHLSTPLTTVMYRTVSLSKPCTQKEYLSAKYSHGRSVWIWHY